MSEVTRKHWNVSIDDAQIAWLTFSREDASTNSLNQEALEAFGQQLDDLSKQDKLTGLIICSGKDNGFIAGADLQHITSLEGDPTKIRAFIELGQATFMKLAQFPKPTVAMVKGFCMGGGTEMILACDYIVACDDDKTRIGLPEVKLGIQPGWGGSVRLFRRAGLFTAMDLMLTGRTLRAQQAAKKGVIDVAVPERQFIRAAQYFIETKPTVSRISFLSRVFFNFKPVRELMAAVFRKNVAKKVKKAHYPAPYRMVSNYRQFGLDSQKAFAVEIDSILDLLSCNNTASNLFRVFFLMERLKSLVTHNTFAVKHVHVVGAGVMGGDIAAWCALQGKTVTLQDKQPSLIAPAIARAAKLYKKKLKKPHLVTQTLDRLIPDPNGIGVPKADVIIEAIFENLEAKQALFAQLEKDAKKEAILASNTSSIPLDEINTVMTHPERLVGIHFFNPVALMPLVEVVKGEHSDEAIVSDAIVFVRQIDRLPLPVKSSPGFLVNRVLMPYLMEAMAILEEGQPGPMIDKAAVDFGMPMGPVELADVVGLDVCLSVAENLSQHFGGQVPERLKQMVADKQLGKKSGSGYYTYKKGKVVKPDFQRDKKLEALIQKRLIDAMVKEAKACLDEHVVADADLLDAGMIFGTGFAPFRGGPLHDASA